MNNYVVIFEEGILVFPMFECFLACVIWDKYFLKGKAPEKIKIKTSSNRFAKKMRV
jgi:hypothetical protein